VCSTRFGSGDVKLDDRPGYAGEDWWATREERQQIPPGG